jgi:hypothetical protein
MSEAITQALEEGSKTPDAAPVEAKPDRGDTYVPEKVAPVEIETAVVEAKPEAKPEEKPAEPERDPKTGQWIPKSRFDEVNRKLRAQIEAAQERVQTLEQQMAAAASGDAGTLEGQLDAKTDEYNRQLADGELDKAKSTMREINKLNRQLMMIEIAPLTTQTVARETNATTLGQLVDFYKTEFPAWDETNADTFQQEQVAWIAEMQGVFEQAGRSPAAALQQAVELAIDKFRLTPASGGGTPAPVKVDPAADRKKGGVQAAVAAASKQPPSLRDLGTDSDKQGMSKIDVTTLDYNDFTKLPESTLKRLRGDLM